MMVVGVNFMNISIVNKLRDMCCNHLYHNKKNSNGIGNCNDCFLKKYERKGSTPIDTCCIIWGEWKVKESNKRINKLNGKDQLYIMSSLIESKMNIK